jgi:hypothetical protein
MGGIFQSLQGLLGQRLDLLKNSRHDGVVLKDLLNVSAQNKPTGRPI